MRIIGFVVIGVCLLAGFEAASRAMFEVRQGLPESAKNPLLDVDVYTNLKALKLIKAERFQMAIFGDSHGQQGIAPECLSLKAFNFSYKCQDLYYSNAMFRLMAPELPELKHVILSLSHFTMGFQVYRSADILTTPYTQLGIPHERHFENVPELAGDGGRRPAPADVGAGFVRDDFGLPAFFEKSFLYRYRAVFWKKARAVAVRSWHKEESEAVLTPEQQFEKGRILKQAALKQQLLIRIDNMRRAAMPVKPDTMQERANIHMDAKYHEISVPFAKHYLNEFIKFALERGIKVTLVMTPVPRSYYDALRPDFIADYQADLDSVLSKYKGNPDVQYLDYSNDPRFEASEFEDCEHLTPAAAKKFTRILNEDIY